MADFTPKLVCFSCNFGWGYLMEKAAMGRHIRYWVPVACSGKIETSHILHAFRSGADGVLVLGCLEGHCHFQDGNYQTMKKIYLLRRVIESFGIEPERLQMTFSNDPEGKSIPGLIREFEENLRCLGPARSV